MQVSIFQHIMTQSTQTYTFIGFDPIFFLHHCNVDRILAFWEYAYPKYFMGKDGYKDQNGNTQQFSELLMNIIIK
jgi:hypothetical protein